MDAAVFPQVIQDFTALFVEMQDKRHAADYAPDVEYRKSDVIRDIVRAENAIISFAAVDIADRRAFAVHVLFEHNR